MLANALVAIGLMAAAFGVAALRRPRAAHAAWLVVLVKLIVPPVVVIPVVLAARAAVEPKSKLPVEPAYPVLPAVPVTEPISAPTGADWIGDAVRDEATPAEEATPVPPIFAAAVPVSEPVNYGRAAFFAWLLGALAWVGVVALRVVRFRRFVATATPADAETVFQARDVAARLGLMRVPEVSFVDGPVSPMLWAVVGRPRILLPRRLWKNFDPDHREAVLAHELAHLARGDHWTRRFELMVLALYWWCPVAWVAVRELRRAEEACCDARVLAAVPGRAAAYAEALVETIAFVNRPGWVPLASGGAARASDLKRRVTMILNSTNGPRATPWLVLAVLIGGLAVLPLAPGLADEPKPPPAVADVDDPPPVPPPPAAVDRSRAADEFRRHGMRDEADMLPPAAPQVAWTTQPDARSGQADLRDEVELLEAQLTTKRAHVRAAERGLKSAATSYDLIRKMAQQGTVSQEEVGKAEATLGNAESELEIRKAEMDEHQVRLKQAKRRLAAGNSPAARTTPSALPASSFAPSAMPIQPPLATPGFDQRSRNADLARPAPEPVLRPRSSSRPAITPAPDAAPRAGNTIPAPAPVTRILPTPAGRGSDDAADRRAVLGKKLNDLMDQYERNQRAIQQMQRQQADLKKMLDKLAAEEKKRGDDLPVPRR
jgi:beta-lactamase regulating signal transducer with metallopeptidase domain